MTLARVLANIGAALAARQARNARRIAARNCQSPGHSAISTRRSTK